MSSYYNNNNKSNKKSLALVIALIKMQTLKDMLLLENDQL